MLLYWQNANSLVPISVLYCVVPKYRNIENKHGNYLFFKINEQAIKFPTKQDTPLPALTSSGEEDFICLQEWVKHFLKKSLYFTLEYSWLRILW